MGFVQVESWCNFQPAKLNSAQLRRQAGGQWDRLWFGNNVHIYLNGVPDMSTAYMLRSDVWPCCKIVKPVKQVRNQWQRTSYTGPLWRPALELNGLPCVDKVLLYLSLNYIDVPPFKQCHLVFVSIIFKETLRLRKISDSAKCTEFPF